MRNVRFAPWLLGFLTVLAPAAHAQTPLPATGSASWEPAESHRGYAHRSFLSDGTVPAVGKGREVKLEVQAASHESPIARAVNLPLPLMPHGFLDPTHPAGPAEPGSAAPVKVLKPRPGPVSSGLVLKPFRR